MQYRYVKHTYYWLLFAAVLLLVVSCSGPGPDGGPVAVMDAEVFVFPGETEKRLISEEKIIQDNCNGAAETSQTVTRQQTVQYLSLIHI